MNTRHAVSRRKFMGGLALAAGYFGLRSDTALLASPPPELGPNGRPLSPEAFDKLAKISFNENPYGPPESVMKAMTGALKYANRYGYPDGGITEAIAKHHGVKTENILLAAGSGEMLDVIGTTFTQGNKKVIGVSPSYMQVYEHVTSVRAQAVTLPLTADYRQPIPDLVKAANQHYR